MFCTLPASKLSDDEPVNPRSGALVFFHLELVRLFRTLSLSPYQLTTLALLTICAYEPVSLYFYSETSLALGLPLFSLKYGFLCQ